MISVNMTVKNQQNFAYAKKIMFGTLVFVLVTVVRLWDWQRPKNCTCTKCLIDDLVDICNETVDTPETISVNSTNKTIYWLLSVVLQVIMCLLLLVIVTAKCYMSHRLIIPCLLLY